MWCRCRYLTQRKKGMGNIKQIQKTNKDGSVMPAHVECAKRTFNALALLTKNYLFFPFY